MRALFVSLIAVFIFSVVSAAQTAGERAPIPRLDHFNIDQVDRALDPCADFFQYTCSKWIKANPIPADLAGQTAFGKLAIWNIAAVRDTLQEAATAKDRSPIQQMVGDYYAACTDEATINMLGIKPLQPALDSIAKLKDKSQLPELIAYLHQLVRPGDLVFTDNEYDGILFGLYQQPDFDDASITVAAFDQAGMGMPGRDFYLKNDDRSKEIQDKYVKHIAKLLQLSGESERQSSMDAQSVHALESALARSAMDIIARRDPKNQNNKMSFQQLQALAPSFDFERYLKAMQAPSSSRYLVLAPDFFRGVDQLIASEPVGHWKAYLRWQTLHFMAPFLSQPFVDETYDFFGRTLAGAQEIPPRWRRCSFSADADLGEAVGQAYVAKYFPEERKERVLQMVHAIEAALNRDIDNAAWMSDASKKAAHGKLAAQIDKIGYPDRWRDYSSLEIKRDDLVGNISRASRFETIRRFSKIGKPTDRQAWVMTPPTVNAYEDSSTNTINFPAGILQPPFFDASAPDAVNYGAIGAVIGHETIHGFDDQGRKFDAQGNLRDWWTPEDAANYEQRDKCIQDEYTQDIPEAGVRQNGALSAGEDTADNGGIHIALSALENTLTSNGKTLDSPARDGFTELQTFFLAYSEVWCSTLRPEAARTAVLTQGHSLDRYRVNNVLGNMPEFDHAFGCHAGQPMVHATQCRVW
jgi:putative endopeptidase